MLKSKSFPVLLPKKGRDSFFMECIPIKGFSNIFLNLDNGEIFTVKDGKDILVPTQSTKDKAQIVINGRHFEILYLILESMCIEHTPLDRVSYKITKAGYVSPDSISIRRSKLMDDEDDQLIFYYKCDVKAASANHRFKDKISPHTVLQVLKISEFKCVYCGKPIDSNLWHLDHFYPKAISGRNVIENLAPSCERCNLMKGSMTGTHFIKRCHKICMNNKILSKKARDRFSKAMTEMDEDGVKI